MSVPAATAVAQTVLPARQAPRVEASLAPPVENLVDSLSSAQVGALDLHKLRFQLSSALPVDARFRITFPEGFDLDSLTNVLYEDTDSASADPGVSSTRTEGQSVLVQLDTTGTSPSAASTIILKVPRVGNDTLALMYQVSLEIYDALDSLLFGPTLSDPFALVPGPAVTLTVVPKQPVALRAGETRTYTALALDTYGNSANADSATYHVDPTLDSIGNMSGSVFFARWTGTGRVVATLGLDTAESGIISVRPNVLDAWDVTGVPSVAVAGETLGGDSIVVIARDAFGNLKYDSEDSVGFAASDSGATFPYDSVSPYVFMPADSGIKAFGQTDFMYVRAGWDTLYVRGSGTETGVPIVIAPAGAVRFELASQDTVVAGEPFSITALQVRDSLDNAASGQIDLYLNPADSSSPDGHRASLPAIVAAQGSGTSQSVLYLSGRYPVFGRIGDTVRTLDSITVLPATAARFRWQLSDPVISTVPVDSPATLTAVDSFANLVDHYDQSGSPVGLSTVGGGPVAPDTLQPSDFSGSVADLHALGLIYGGRGGLVEFVASTPGAQGTSLPVNVQGLFARAITIDQATVRRGTDTLTGTITVSVDGTGLAAVTALTLLTPVGSFTPSGVLPALPAGIVGPAGDQAFDFTWAVPAGIPIGSLLVAAAVQGQLALTPVQDTTSGSAAVDVRTGSDPVITVVSPDSVAYDTARYDVTVTNEGLAGLTIVLDSSALLLDGGMRDDTAHSVHTGQAFLGPGDTLELSFASRHASGFEGDSAMASLQLHGTELSQPVTIGAPYLSPLRFVTPAQLAYIPGTLNPNTIVVQQANTIGVRIANTGGIRLLNTDVPPPRLWLAGAADTVVLTLASARTPLTSLPPGDTLLAFDLSSSAARLTPGPYALRFELNGHQNGIPVALAVDLTDSMAVVGAPSIQVQTAYVVAAQQPRVSTGQTFSVESTIQNIGAETLTGVATRLTTDGRSVLLDTTRLLPGVLLPDSSFMVTWSVVADSVATSVETFRVFIDSARGVSSGRVADIVAPGSSMTDQTSIQIQTSASVSVVARIDGPAEALDGRIAAGSQFRVAGRFTNSGEAPSSGALLRIIADGGVTVTSPADTIRVGPDIDVIWTLTAPSTDTAARIDISFDTFPTELNTTQPAFVAQDLDTLEVTIAFEVPPLQVVDVQTSGGAVTDPYVPLSWSWQNKDPSGSFPLLVRQLDVSVLATDGITLIPAVTVFTSARLEMDDDTVAAVFSGETLRFGTGNLRWIPPGDSEGVVLRAVPVISSTVTEFVLSTGDARWTVQEQSVGGAGLPVEVVDRRGQTLAITTAPAFLPGSSASNYPNPFRAGFESTHIQYSLASNADVELVIYTTAGREVWRHKAASGSAGGTAGVNSVDWDGRNGDGNVVIDGIYIVRITGGGLDESVKIAVFK